MTNPFRAIGRGARAVVVRPVNAAKRRAEMVIVMAIARHLVTALGGALVAQGMVTTQENTELVGALLTLVGIGASIIQKRRQA